MPARAMRAIATRSVAACWPLVANISPDHQRRCRFPAFVTLAAIGACRLLAVRHEKCLVIVRRDKWSHYVPGKTFRKSMNSGCT